MLSFLFIIMLSFVFFVVLRVVMPNAVASMNEEQNLDLN
jgi:hypothetical protein